MTCRPSILLAAALLAGCGAQSAGPDHADWRGMLRAGDGVGAEIALREELEAGGKPADLAPYLGEAEMLQGNLADAEHWLTGGAFAPGAAAHGAHMLGRLRMRQGDLPAAGKAFDRALSGAADNPELWVDIARLRWRGGEQVQALDASKKALALGPDNPAALLLRAQMVRDAAGNGGALPLLERGLAKAPGNPELLGEYAATLGELGRAKDMLAATRKLAAAAPGDRRVLWLQAVLAARAGQADLARNLLQRGGDLDRQMPAAILLLGLVDLDNGNYGSAAQGFDRLLRMQPDNRRVALLLARALALGGNHRELAARFAPRADTPYLAALVGRAYEAIGEREKAAPFLDRARGNEGMRLAVIPTTTAIDVAELRGTAEGANVVALVRGLLAARRAPEARAKAQTFAGRFPGSADARALLGDAMFEAGDAKAALAEYRKAAAIRRPWSLTKRMAAALDRSGDPAGATALIAAHLAGEPNNADAVVLLARRLVDRGDYAGARAHLARARALDRNDPLLARLAEGG